VPGIARAAIALAALAALAALCALALPRGLADLRGFEARMLFRSWQAGHRQPSLEEWTSARDLLREAQALDPGQPNYLEDLGRLYELSALPLKAGDDAARVNLRRALDYQRQAARIRPGSPYTWANIALLKARLPEPDREFETALRNAALLGPWEPEVQLALADAGFRHWRVLAPETHAALRANALRALRRQDAKLFELARRTGRLDVLCTVRGIERSRLARACI
jgi:tetratricopeptide (TPR) repeat protein